MCGLIRLMDTGFVLVIVSDEVVLEDEDDVEFVELR